MVIRLDNYIYKKENWHLLFCQMVMLWGRNETIYMSYVFC